MRRLITLLSAAAMLASCGGGQTNSGNQQGDNTDTTAQAECVQASVEKLPEIDSKIIQKAFDKLIKDNMATQVLEDSDNYDFGTTFCHYTGENIAGARINSEAGNYAALGCFAKPDGNILVVKYELIQHFNGHSFGEGPEVTYHSYDPKTDNFAEISKPDFIDIDSADFWLDNSFVRYGNDIYFQFSKDAIILSLTNSEDIPGQTYKWNGTKFVKQPVDAAIMAKAHTNDYQNSIPAQSFSPSKTEGNTGTVTDKDGKTEVIIHYNDNQNAKSINILSPKYWVDGTGVGEKITSVSEYTKISTGSDGNKIGVCEAELTTATFKADSKDIIKEIEVVFKNVKDAEDIFNVPDTCELDDTGRKILKLIAAKKPIDFYVDVMFLGATQNSATFETKSPSGEWDNSVYYQHDQISFGYYKMSDGKYIAYLHHILDYDEMNDKDLRYTKKDEYNKFAYIYDGNSVTETEFNLPNNPNDMPSNYELDPVPVYSFGDKYVTVTYDCNVNIIDLEDMPKDQPSSSKDFDWTGNGWKECPQE